MKKFDIIGDGKVIGVGLRPALLGLASEYDLQIACRNLWKENRVEVVVNGTEDNIERFWSYIKNKDIRLFPDIKMYDVSELETYEGPKIDWGYYTQSLTSEQLYRGFQYVGEALKDINRNFGKAIEKFGGLSNKLDEISSKLDSLPKEIAKVMREYKKSGK